jgi:nucleotide-binding universal stress UspA family protein
MYRHLLAATDGSELSNLAVEHAIDLAKGLGAKLTLLHVAGQYPPPMLVDGTVFPTLPQDEHDAAVAKQSQEVLEPCLARARAAGVDCEAVHESDSAAWHAIMEVAARAGCDVIVMGSHGRGGIASLIMGSQTQKVLHHTNLPVLVVRQARHAATRSVPPAAAA